MKSKKNVLLSAIIVCFIFFVSVSVIYAVVTVISGKAKVMNTGNTYLDFTHYNANVSMDQSTGILSGYAFLKDLGWVAMGTTDNVSGPVTVNLTTGAVTGIAKVLNTGNTINFSASSSNVTFNSSTNQFSGYVFSTDVGWINFSDTGVILGEGGYEDVGYATAAATFNSIGIYWNPPSATSSATATMEFKESGASTWNEGYPLWYSAASNQYRGSAVHLKSGTTYDIHVKLTEIKEEATFSVTTWNENFPIAQTVYLPENSSSTLTISQSGTANGYILYTHSPGQTATIDVANAQRNDIVIDAAYVILRDVTLKGAQRDAIHIYPTSSHDVVIENNDISGWGNIKYTDTGFGEDSEAAIRANTSPNVSRVIIQRNIIHDPRPDTNSWGETRPDVASSSAGTHPTGPQAVYLYQSGGNHVIRYNTIYSTNEHRFNDCIGGGANSSDQGFPNKDTDIYGNYISHCWDNGIEAEGGNQNIRIWGNYIDETYRALANRDTRIGPLYVWRNISNKSRKYPEEQYTWSQDPHGSLSKAGGETVPEHGVFYFHNTALQPVTGQSFTGGIATGLDGPMQDTTTRNNILHTYCTSSGCDGIKLTGGATTNSFDYDLFNKNVSISGAESHGINGTPIYTSAYGFNYSNYQGNFELDNSSPGYDDGVIIANFNSHLYKGAAPDIGAQEAGMPPMQFGVNAYLSGDPYTVGYVAPTNSSSSSSNSDSSTEVQKECTSIAPDGRPDLFQIDRQGKTATLYFTPVQAGTNKYFISYGDGTRTDQYGTSFSNTESGVVKFVISDLTPGNKYSFKVSAGYDCAIGPESNIMSVSGIKNNGVRVSFYKNKTSSQRNSVPASRSVVKQVENENSVVEEPTALPIHKATPKPTTQVSVPNAGNGPESLWSKFLRFIRLR